jgi:hypothetical protein
MTTSMAESWKNASPTVPFPFSGRSAMEMRDRINSECHSGTLHMTTAHFAPSSSQNHFMMERFTKEYNVSSPHKTRDQHELTQSMRGLELPRLSPRARGQESLNGTQTLHSVRSSPRRAHDMDLLREHGRQKYLHMKRLEPSARDELIASFITSSRQVGEQVFAGPSPFAPMLRAPEDFRRQGGGMKSSFRTRGVFSS